MTIKAILETKGSDIVSVQESVTVEEAAKLLSEHRIGALLVLGAGGRIAGVLSERDIVRGISRHGVAILAEAVATLMTRNVISCSIAATVEQAMSLMTDRRIRHLPVVDEGTLAGIISIGDVVKARIAETEREAEQLREFITAG